MRITGIYENIGAITYFIPHALPPADPALQLTPAMIEIYSQALYNLGMLNETSKRIPNQHGFVDAYIKKEAILSSQIEGIHTTLMDLFVEHKDIVRKQDKNRQLVANYIHALDVACTMMQSSNLPICSRVILAMHKALLTHGSGDQASPGVYRKQTVQVGNLVPAPAPQIISLLSDLEKFINEDESLPALIKAGLVHLQFETIHPFLDGNGRIGRLLIILMLLDSKLLNSPILYVSYYFKKHHLQYYQALDRVRTHGDFEGWIIYYLQAINQTALDANKRAKEIEDLQVQLQKLIMQDPLCSRIQSSAVLLLQALFFKPIATTSQISADINKAYNTTSHVIDVFVQMKILSKVDSNASYLQDLTDKRSQYYIFDAYIDLLNKEYITL